MIIGLPQKQDLTDVLRNDPGEPFRVYRPSFHLDVTPPKAFPMQLRSGILSYDLLSDNSIRSLKELAVKKYGKIIESYLKGTLPLPDDIRANVDFAGGRLVLEESILNDDEVTHRGAVVAVEYGFEKNVPLVKLLGRYGRFLKSQNIGGELVVDYRIPVKDFDNRIDVLIGKLSELYSGNVAIGLDGKPQNILSIKEMADGKKQGVPQAMEH